MTQSPRFTLIVPGIGSALLQSGELVQAEALARLAGRGSVRLSWDRRDGQQRLRPWQRGLLHALDISATDLASAPLSALGCGLAANEGYWLHAEPIHLAAGLDRLTFVRLEGEARVTMAEHAALTQTLATHFPAGEFTLHAASGEWFIRSARNLEVITATPEAAATNDLQSMMPRGVDAPALRRLMTELQMLLHEHSINDKRASRGLPAVNALWLWGGGVAPTFDRRALPRAFGEDAFLAGLYRMHGHSVAGLPDDPGDLPDSVNAERLLALAHTTEIQLLESQWIAPLSRMLTAGRIGGLDLILDQWQLQADRAAQWRFWRRPLPPARWEQAS